MEYRKEPAKLAAQVINPDLDCKQIIVTAF
jgi:hypothetical protein